MSDLTGGNEIRSKATPVLGGERIAAVDVLRGFAVFGILMVNIYGFSGLLLSPQSETDRLDRLVMMLVILLFQAKFYSLFSFLFGWGMSIQLERAVKKGASFVRLYRRRMLVLLLFGLIHGILLWRGDILTTYAVLGLGLLLFRNSKPRTLLIWVVLFLLLAIVAVLPGNAMEQARELYAQLTEFMRTDNMPPQTIFGHGSYGEITQRRMGEFITSQSWFIYWLGNVVAMMLLGLYAGKRRILQDVEGHLPLIRRTLWLGLIIGLAFNALSVWVTVDANAVAPQYQRFARVSTRTIGAPALMLFYASAIILLMQREAWRQRLKPLAPVGRMALSNYLLQSVIAGLVFYGYGLGLYGDITPTVALIIVIVIYTVQIWTSEWWMERFQFGPAEWLWRSLTYGQLQPLRRDQPGFVGQAPSLLSRLRNFVGAVNPTIYLAAAWILLIVWAGALYAWNGRLDLQSGGRPFTLFAQETPVVSATATPARPVAAGAEPEPRATPVVRPLAYQPSAAAAAGDIQAMTGSIDVDQAMTHIEALAGPAFAGRLAGSPGGEAAGDYIADMFARYRLRPAGQDGTFFQSFPLTYTVMSGSPLIEVTLPDGMLATDYEVYEEYAPVIIGYAGGGDSSGPVHWVNRCRVEDFADLELLDKIVFCKPEPGSDALVSSSRLALEYGAAGLLLLMDDQDRPADFAARYQEVWVPETIPVLRVYPPLAADLLAGSGLTTETLLLAEEPLALDTQARLSVETYESARFDSRNVLGVLPGRDPEYADEVIVVGAHYDHMGEGPDGTVWSGANDNASGAAAMLEIARSWSEHGFVPRRTVLFAAWDAEEWGLIGSRYYIQHPSYPLENTVASIQMDMVGAGPDTLVISGEQELAQQLLDVAEAIEIEAMIGNMGRSDHVSFLEAGIPATLLIWYSDEEAIAHYHRPSDTPEVIEPQKLAAVMEVAGTTLLDLVESEPAIEQLVAKRALAAAENDLSAFLSTSRADQAAVDNGWFAGLQALDPQEFTLSIEDIRFQGATATAGVTLDFAHLDGENVERVRMSQPVHFTNGGGGWQWAGPALSWYRTDETLAESSEAVPSIVIGYPTTVQMNAAPLAHLVADTYAQVAQKMGLPEHKKLQLMLLPDAEAIRFGTDLSLTAENPVWVEPGLAKLEYSPEISRSQVLTDTIVHLVLADAGITEEAAPWLWHGLPIAWQAEQDIKDIHGQYLPALTEALQGEAEPAAASESWAAVEYLLQKAGWPGAGQFIQDFGLACVKEGCGTAAGVDRAMIHALQMDAATFHESWQTQWRAHLAEVQASLDQLLQERAAAILSGDKDAFLATVDSNDPQRLSTEAYWFDRQVQHPLADLSFSSQPITLFPNGDVLAQVTIDYQTADPASELQQGQVATDMLFTVAGDGYRWAGVAGQSLAGESITIRFPEGQQELARALLQEAEGYYTDLAATLEIETPQPITIELYPNRESFHLAIGLVFPTAGWLPAWSEPGSGIKMQLQASDAVADYRSALVNQLARNLLYQKGVTAEWLLKGIAAQVSVAAGDQNTQQALAAKLIELSAIGADGASNQLATIQADEMLSGAAWLAETARAWDSAGYLIAAEGWPSVLAFIELTAELNDAESAFPAAFGRSLAGFEQEWKANAAGGYASPRWVEAMNDLDGAAALEHVNFLGDEKLAGRQAGTPGAEIAAAYIANRFAEYGLQPAGDTYAGSYYHTFPITVTERIGEPSLQILDDPSPYSFRVDFLPVYSSLEKEAVRSELVWLDGPGNQAQAEPELDLSGKIALMATDSSTGQALELATSHDAAGLILLGLKRDDLDLYAKQPLAPSILAEIPVLELTLDGTLRLLELLDSNLDDIQDLPSGTHLGIEAQMASSALTRGQVKTSNVLGMLPGTDPLLSKQVLIVGAHYDHVGDDKQASCTTESSECPPPVRYSGLNDNASGIGVMLEIARLWQEIGYRPKHTVLFAAWGAQEAGQIGSDYYMQNPIMPLTSTMAMIQLDGLGGGEGFYPGLHGRPGYEDQLINYVTTAAQYFDQKVVVASSDGESDHLAFRQRGVPAMLVSWRLASENNLPDGLANGVSAERLTTSGRVIALSLMMLAR